MRNTRGVLSCEGAFNLVLSALLNTELRNKSKLAKKSKLAPEAEMDMEAAAQKLDEAHHEQDDIRDLIGADTEQLTKRLRAHRLELFPPSASKTIRRFSPVEAAKLIGINDGYLRQISQEGKAGSPEVSNTGRRFYSVEDLSEIRAYLDANTRSKRRYVPHRTGNEHLQVISVMNFKGGSGKTTTATHLAQYLAFKGYRVLAVDLDPQASLSAMFGQQPEFDVGPNETLYGAIRYDDERRELAEIIRPTYVAGLDLVPGNLELMEFEHETPKALTGRGAEDLMFFARLSAAFDTVADRYDVIVIDCPPQLGFLTLSAICAATSVLLTVHPQMLDVMSMNQFLIMMRELLDVVAAAGGNTKHDWLRYLITRYEPGDGPQTQMVGFMRSMFGQRVLTHPMVKSTAIADAGITKQTLYEVDRQQFTRSTYDRAIEALDLVNAEIEALVQRAWGRA
jgi:chromosome partitioning protein